MRGKSQRGVTLIELTIAITLVAALLTGMLMVMRTGLITYEKLNFRLADNRRVVGMQQTLERQISGAMPVSTGCAGQPRPLSGDAASMRFVSTDSLAEGSRGYPRIVSYHVEPDPQGGVRLMLQETYYTGVASQSCDTPMPGQAQVESMQMAGKLAICRLWYQDRLPESPLGGAWLPAWSKPILPRAVRVEMAPLDVRVGLPMLTLDVPIRITREPGVPYVDE